NLSSLYLIKKRKILIKHEISIINKRIFDFLFSFLFIIFIYWWVYLIVFFLIKAQSKGPILFKQERVGLDGEIFNCYKFRTMHIDDTNSKILTKIGDVRIFPFGKFMRKTNIDEFPQFLNVLIGNMSVVGPRPHMLSEDKILADKIEKYRMRRWTKPGITGFAAIQGFRGGTESMDLMQKRINLDVRYIEKWSFWLDLKICYLTILETLFLKSKGH
ncbi:sugar transferase, partial [bacterium]|nr:sugar transferase [bacterium]